ANFIGETNFLEGKVVSTAKGQAKIALDAGTTITASLGDGAKPSGKVTVVVRPEHASLVAASGKATLSGKLENIVYFGTDTHYHVKLHGGSEFTVRHQNVHAGALAFEKGDKVGVLFGADAARVLRD
ncbi:MAG TPA: TOBE domain-containing protein, partial [Aestuariivirga sp.]|nr:TOBE domain-containing protein [Aestuariivirga sp.]